jgi:CheY-like chemotaxis protein
MAIRQALLNIFTGVARRASGACLLFHATVQEQTVILRLSTPSNEELAALSRQGNSENLRMASELIEPAGGTVAFTVTDDRFEVRLQLPSEQSITVLAVDDNPDTLQLLSRYAANTRYHLIGVSQAERVMATAQSLLPEIIVLDVMMPQIDGWELLGKLRTHPDLAAVSIIVCTILPQEQLARSLGAAGFLRKPISRSDFLAALDVQAATLR